jgi:hypothetical protein
LVPNVLGGVVQVKVFIRSSYILINLIHVKLLLIAVFR